MRKLILYQTSLSNMSSIFVLLLLCWSLFLFFNYCEIFGGDPEIHMIFAKNLFDGKLLQFNPGFYTGGETSPLYMVIVAFLMKVKAIPIQFLLKLLSYLALLFILIIFYIDCKSNSSINRLLGALLFSSMAFVPFQVSLGMENILFAFFCLLIIRVLYSKNLSNGQYFSISTLLYFAFFLRPEAIFIYLYALILSILKKNRSFVTCIVVSFCISAISYETINLYTGVETQSAGIIRAFTSKSEATAFTLGYINLFVNFKPLRQAVYLCPLIFFMLHYRRYFLRQDLLLILVFFIMPFFLHLLSFLPNTHYSRYALYSYCILFYIFNLRIIPNINRLNILLLTFSFAMLSFLEYSVREELPRFSVSKSIAEFNPSFIENFSDKLYEKLHHDSLNNKITIALQEVQLRSRLDDRFVVWSLDGITDSDLAHYISDGYIDHFSYIKNKNIQYLQGPLFNYNHDKTYASLADYTFASDGYTQCLNGIKLQNINYLDFYKVIKCP